jgi:hypothetical protein
VCTWGAGRETWGAGRGVGAGGLVVFFLSSAPANAATISNNMPTARVPERPIIFLFSITFFL